jgi:polysaccharide pyruvyl transferase WcaK-like protein
VKILLINSDLAKNRGDRAIAEGLIQLINDRWPNADITGLSEHAPRDSEWFKINFLPIDSQSVNPLHMLRLLRESRNSDIIMWGGGELLKDYTNKISLWYWVVKMFLISLTNKNIYGVYQGIGPTSANSSKRLIRFIVNRCKLFIVRDHLSYKKLIRWGANNDRVLEASDPAIIPQSTPLTTITSEILHKDFGIDADFLKKCIAVGPRDWFHYKKGGFIPYKYRRHFSRQHQENSKHKLFLKQLDAMCSEIISLGYNVLLIPMHMSEEDIKLCDKLMKGSIHSDKIRALNKDILSPAETRSILSLTRGMVGLRLHSTIIANASGVPALTYYYVDKGRAFFEQLGNSEFAQPIESMLEESFVKDFNQALTTMLRQTPQLKKSTNEKISELRARIRVVFKEIN